jgi:cation diffusion facilitator family transporter
MIESKLRATRLLVAVVAGLIALKVVFGWVSGSVAMLAQAADSLLDLVAAVVSASAVRVATQPADEEHPYGHGKVEDLAGVAQAVLILIVAGFIIYSSVDRLVEGARLMFLEGSMGVMVVSVMVSVVMARYLKRVARVTDSVVLEANANNIAADVYSALAVLVGLAAVRLTGAAGVDSIIAIGVALYIVKVAIDTMHKPLSGLLDQRLPEGKEAVIRACLRRHAGEVAGYHALRSRRAGSQLYVDAHLVMSKDIDLSSAHSICDRIEKEIESELPGISATIHAEPCDGQCKYCRADCARRHAG